MAQKQVDLSNNQTPYSPTKSISLLVKRRFEECRNVRMIQEQKWIAAKMAFDGVDYNSQQDNQTSGIYLNFTQMKTMSAYSQIMATMSGPQGYPWNIKPTPDPELVKAGIRDMQEAEKMGGIPEQLQQKVLTANMACDLMRVRIEDDLTETRWEEKFSQAVLDLVILGTTVIKGPFGTEPEMNKWVKTSSKKNKDGSGTMESFFAKQGVGEKFSLEPSSDDFRPIVDAISPFEFYPDPSANDIKDCMWAIHRHAMNKAQLVDLAKIDGFEAKEIKNVLESYPSGNWVSESWESKIFSINKDSSESSKLNRYLVLEHWGYLSKKELVDAGLEVTDEDQHKQYMTCVWTVGDFAIKISVSGLDYPYLPFMVCPYEKVLYSMWGRGIPEKMKDPQEIVNAAARAMVDNMGIAAGPQVIFDSSRMVNGFKFEGLKPWGVWPIKSMEGMSAPPVQFAQTPSILGELKLLQDNFKMFIQEVTSMPDMTQGYAGSASGQHNRTASGMSMLFNAANNYIKGVVFNIDTHVTKPLIRRMYDWNMQFSTDESIKGDYRVDAGGVQSLITQESKMSSLGELAQMMQDPAYAPYINKTNMLKEWVRSRGFNGSDIINSEQEAERLKQMSMQQEAQKAQMSNVPKLRAETPRPDALLQVLDNTDPTSPAYPAIYEMVILSQNAMTPMMQDALDLMKSQAIHQAMSILKEEESENAGIPPEMMTKSQPDATDMNRRATDKAQELIGEETSKKLEQQAQAEALSPQTPQAKLPEMPQQDMMQ